MEERSDKGTWPQNTIGVGKSNVRRLIQDLIALRACISASVSQYSAAKKIEEEAELTIHNLNSEIGKTLAAIQKLKHTFAQNNGNAQTISTRKERLSLAKIVEENAKPGITLRQLNQMVVDFYKEELPKHGLNKDVSEYYFHGVSHYLGLDTHDVGSGMSITLEKGNIITNEPGLYIEDEGLGIRIEDDLLITDNGCEVLSIEIPKSIEDIEKVANR